MIPHHSVRNNVFWLKDSIKGGHLRKDLNDIISCFKISSFQLLQNKTAPVLKNLLDVAVNSTEFYSAYKSY